VLDSRHNFPAKLSIPQVFELNRHSHPSAIVSNGNCPTWVQSG